MTGGDHSDSKLEERSAILERVRRGEMTTQAAEQWAANNGQTFYTSLTQRPSIQ
jgi:hypothetical protein